jgi:hypothetical protein
MDTVIRRSPKVWIACILLGAAAGAGMGWSVTRTERLAQKHMFEESRGPEGCNFKYCDAKPVGKDRWSRTFHRVDGQGSSLPGGILELHFCAQHLGQDPNAFRYRLPVTTAVPLWIIVGVVVGAILGAFVSRRKKGD